ncbi:2-C-methyl-D-erythritol 4-phosphate cytidylyltransferase [Pusillimonas sp. ANT_WB101]|uniref:2-C-methyl-D-erythritol 4-phosphate cytidylyltransferase n=1 Tax=Pusillimonas sp. ANT_WB101 TaxID=2597356 RepID=UPI0011EC068D|nr:2-C-methyl-D-erythritol 4-phosphate cytidylyltransferase [Pusillimonas sp. ANT_WB101]KAA0888630.1 2-C-methyl-D-erythritol 4-phosphate cytidylyltransferase [Pusillimonas sp. ANT_WB101]
MHKKLIAIVPAAGIGARALTARKGPNDAGLTARALPKQYRLLNGEPMLRLSVQALLADARIAQVRVAVAASDPWVAQVLSGLPRTVWRPCGGPTRAETVLAALRDARLDPDDWVLVHDAARPGLPIDALGRLIDTCLSNRAGGLLAQPVADTVKRAASTHDTADMVQHVKTSVSVPSSALTPDGESCGTSEHRVGAPQSKVSSRDAAVVAESVPRDGLWLAQTPQMFLAGRLLAALEAAAPYFDAITDEASALERAGYTPCLVPGSVRNFKVTWPEDFALMEKWL